MTTSSSVVNRVATPQTTSNSLSFPGFQSFSGGWPPRVKAGSQAYASWTLSAACNDLPGLASIYQYIQLLCSFAAVFLQCFSCSSKSTGNISFIWSSITMQFKLFTRKNTDAFYHLEKRMWPIDRCIFPVMPMWLKAWDARVKVTDQSQYTWTCSQAVKTVKIN